MTTMMNFTLQIVFMKLAFNHLPHALGLVEPFDTTGKKLPPSSEYTGLSEPSTIEEGLEQSMREETAATTNYRIRAEHARLHHDPDTAKVYDHVISEEIEHYHEFGQRLQQLNNERRYHYNE
jgi:rubrerythrin